MPELVFYATLFVLLSISALSAGINSGMFSLNHYQLKHKAQLGNKDAKAVYPLHGLRYELLVALLLLNIVANASIVVLLSQRTSGFLAVLLSTAFILIFGEILPMIYLRKYVI